MMMSVTVTQGLPSSSGPRRRSQSTIRTRPAACPGPVLAGADPALDHLLGRGRSLALLVAIEWRAMVSPISAPTGRTPRWRGAGSCCRGPAAAGDAAEHAADRPAATAGRRC